MMEVDDHGIGDGDVRLSRAADVRSVMSHS